VDEDGRISLWQRLVGPSPRIQGAEPRVAARLMAVLMLAHVAAIALGLAMGDMFWRRTVGATILRGWDAFGLSSAPASSRSRSCWCARAATGRAWRSISPARPRCR